MIPAMRGWGDVGGSVIHCALTIRHDRTQDLKMLMDLLTVAWKRFTLTAFRGSGKQPAKVGELIRLPWLRVLQVTRGESGWHPHYHAMIFLPAGESINLAALNKKIESAWIEAVAFSLRPESKFFRRYGDMREECTPLPSIVRNGVREFRACKVTHHGKSKDCPCEALGWYALAAMDLLRDDLKDGGDDPLSLLDNPDTAYLWVEYAQAVDGKRLVQWGGVASARSAVVGAAAERVYEVEEEAPTIEQEVRVSAMGWVWLTGGRRGARITAFYAAVRLSLGAAVDWWDDNAPESAGELVYRFEDVPYKGRRIIPRNVRGYTLEPSRQLPATAEDCIAHALDRARRLSPWRLKPRAQVKVNIWKCHDLVRAGRRRLRLAPIVQARVDAARFTRPESAAQYGVMK